jgi:alpha-galactosidase
MSGPGELVHLRRGGVSVLLETHADRLPTIRHWQGDFDDPSPTWNGGRVPSGLDDPGPVGLLPEYARGYAGRPGLVVRRHGPGASWAPRFDACEVTEDGSSATVDATDSDLGLALRSELVLEESGVLRVRHTVTNPGDDPLDLVGLVAVLPVPDRAAELLHLTGRWCRERHPQRQPFVDGAVVREGRHGRTGHAAAGRGGAGLRLPPRRGVGRPRGLERRPRDVRRATAGVGIGARRR